MIERAKTWARAVKTDTVALYIAAKDSRTPSLAKFISIAVVVYALSPIDLIPDFIPVLGYVDDLLIVPFGILLAVRMIPPTLMGKFRSRASDHERLPKSEAGAMVVIFIWMAGTGVAGWWIFLRI